MARGKWQSPRRNPDRAGRLLPLKKGPAGQIARHDDVFSAFGLARAPQTANIGATATGRIGGLKTIFGRSTYRVCEV
jgi:hypothetical protein